MQARKRKKTRKRPARRPPSSLSLRLRHAEEQLQSVIELSSDFYWEQDEHHRFTLYRHRNIRNPEEDPERLLGKTNWEMGGTLIGDNENWDGHKAVREARQTFSNVIHRLTRRDGETQYVSLSGQPRFGPKGRFLGYRGIARDVTPEIRAEQLLQLEHSVTRILADTEHAEDALKAAIRAVCESRGWQAGSFWKLDEPAGILRFDTGWSITDNPGIVWVMEQARGIVFGPGVGLPGAVLQNPETLHVADIRSDPRISRHDVTDITGWNSALLFPVASEGRLIGVLDFYAPRIPAPDERLLHVIRVLGQEIGHFYDRATAMERLRESEERFSSTTKLAAIGIAHTSPDGHFLYANQQLCDMLGYSEDELLKLTYAQVSHPDDASVTNERRALLHAGKINSLKVEKRYLRKDGRPIWVSLTVTLKRDTAGRPVHDISIIEDISARKLAEERVQYLATHDGLTGLPNRSMFSQVLNLAIETARRYRRGFAVMFVDLDRFKAVNDTLGHDAGDALLKEIAIRLTGCLRSSDVIARLGGDEFIVLVQEVEDARQVATVARNVLSVAHKPMQILGQECGVTASIGIAMFPDDGEDEGSLMKFADMAMYEAKGEGKNNFKFYSDKLRARSIERMTLETGLRRALERREFALHYQPKIEVRSGRLTGVEALLRWNSPEHGQLLPAQFISLAEETGLIIPIGRWVLRNACAQNIAWQRQGLPPLCMAVNLSPVQFNDNDLLVDIDAVLKETGLAPELLELEVTETAVMLNPGRALRILSGIKELGVRLAIDDFGTGYSSLAQLKRFPIDTLKVDRSFIQQVPSDPEDRAITEAIIAMGKTLSLTVVAEGVETAEQRAFLDLQSCDQMQGFYFEKPLDPEGFEKLLRDYRPGVPRN